MSVRIKYSEEPDFVTPKLEDLDVEEISLSDYELSQFPIISQAPVPSVEDDSEEGGDSWFNWTLSISLDGVDNVLKGGERFFKELDRITQQLTQVLKIIRLLSGNVRSASNFLKYAIKKLVKELKELIDSLSSLGIFMSTIPTLDKLMDSDNKFPYFGGYEEFIQRVNNTCLSSTDPDAPKFEDADKVGGVVIGMIGGVSDLNYLTDLMDNLKKLSDLFGFKSFTPPPAKNFSARAAFFRKDGQRKLGVKLTWEAPDFPVGHFYVYKKTKEGTVTEELETSSGIKVKVKLFTAEEPITKVNYFPGRAIYSYTDFDIQPDSTAFYKIYSLFNEKHLTDHPQFRDVKSTTATPTLKVKIPLECIPLSELKRSMNLSIKGEILNPIDLEGEWQSISVRNLMGEPLDAAYRNLDDLSEKLLGLIDSGSDAINTYLKFYGKRVKYLLDILTKIRRLYLRLASYSMRGTFMVLRLPIETGGMRGFVDRFNEACNSGEADKPAPKEKKDIEEFLRDAVQVQKNSPIAKYREKGLMAGVILLTGIPDLGNKDRLKEFVPESEFDAMKAQVESTEKAITTLMKMLGLE